MTAGRFMGQAVAAVRGPPTAHRARPLHRRRRRARCLDAAFLRSDVARGSITGLDVEAARAAPGVRAVFTAADLNPLVHDTGSTFGAGDAPYPPKYCLAENDVRFVGDPSPSSSPRTATSPRTPST